ncbi:MAG: hypothetical protein JWP97_6021 [Labilithrix sp.]|nr:hypothetical protein [Labilithrix sp.]
MSRFIEDAIGRAGLLPVLTAHRAGDAAGVHALAVRLGAADLLVLGAAADILRAEDSGPTVRIHDGENASSAGVTWVEPTKGASELDTLRAVAIARITGPLDARVGIDWSQCGMELAQVALGFGASELRGPITRKSGLPIYEDEKQKVKGQGMVELRSIKKLEIAALVTHAGRVAVFVEEEGHRAATAPSEVQRV